MNTVQCANCDKPATSLCGGCDSAAYCGQSCANAHIDTHAYELVDKRWIQGTHMHKGALTRQAKRHGMTVEQYEAAVESGRIKATGKTKRRVALAETLKRLNQK